MAGADDIATARAILRFDEALAIVGGIVAPIAAWDVKRIRQGKPSVSMGFGFFFRRWPKTCWVIWALLGVHFAIENARDPVTRFGAWLRP